MRAKKRTYKVHNKQKGRKGKVYDPKCSTLLDLPAAAPEPEKITLKEKIAYGIGDVGNNFLFDLGQIYLLKFYIDSLGIPSAIAGLFFLITKIWDAFADISGCTWADNRNNIGPKGKFRPFILYAAIPLAYSIKMVCLMMKPLQWYFLFVLYTVERKPEKNTY